MLPLIGIKVVEITKNIEGFYGGMILADLGAEVIRVERPESDPARDGGPIWRAAKFVAFNRNKKSLAIDLNSMEGKVALKKLLKISDIFLEDYERNSINDLGFSYRDVSNLNPKIMYLSIKDCLEGPYQDRQWTPGVIDAESGFMSTTGEPSPFQPLTSDKPPVRLGMPVTAVAAGTYGAMWAMVTLLTRDKTRKGEYIKIGKFETAVSLVQQWVTNFSARKTFEKHAATNYKTKDDKWVYYQVAQSDQSWNIFCKAFGVSEEDREATAKWEDRVAAGIYGIGGWVFTDKLNKIVGKVSAQYTKQEIWKKLIDSRVPGGAINDIKTIVEEDPHIKATKHLHPLTPDPEVTLTPEKKTFLSPLLPLFTEDYNSEVSKNWTPPPRLGEHSFEILRSIGYTESEVTSLRKSRVVWPY